MVFVFHIQVGVLVVYVENMGFNHMLGFRQMLGFGRMLECKWVMLVLVMI